MVKYCIPLNSSSPNDESMILLSSLPREVDEQSLSTVMKSYGAVRAVHYQADFDGDGTSSYMVEFYDVQDARQAIMELESTQPWGAEVTVTFGANSAEKRKIGRDLLSLLGRWRHGGTIASTATNGSSGVTSASSSHVTCVSASHHPYDVSRASPALSTASVSRTPPLPSVSPVHIVHQLGTTEGNGSSHSLASSSGTNTNSRAILINSNTGARASVSPPVLSSESSSPVPQGAMNEVKSKSPLPHNCTENGHVQNVASSHNNNVVLHNNNDPSNASMTTSSSSATATTSQQRQTTQLVLGPDGQYSYVMINTAHHAGHLDPHHSAAVHGSEHVLLDVNHPQSQQPPQQHIVHGPHGTYTTSLPPQLLSPPGVVPHSQFMQQQHYHWHHPQQHHHVSQLPPAPLNHHQYHHHHITTGGAPAGAPGATTIIHSPYGEIHRYTTAAVPMYATQLGSIHPQPPPAGVDSYSSVSSGGSSVNNNQQQQHISPSKGNARHKGRGRQISSLPKNGNAMTSNSSGGEDGEDQLTLDIESVKSGKDRRSSLMVRNIPNKYTQSMLLSEFADGNHGPDKIDFFYLPIDFKNRCNRGYAFVNFVNYQDIISFHELYNGKNWKNFNSDKICDITYARIQGKEGMLRRFENSALMEKDDEYRPLVFVSHGIDKGKREEFPMASNNRPHSGSKVSCSDLS
mmetsp:Transcript_36675/g.53725  ORF Transcript_36675/g.53725 Transcript_36675/m.53725 type:complete len:687 (-) Transcript_36675:168-2228(-)